jgi:hypothetical protein
MAGFNFFIPLFCIPFGFHNPHTQTSILQNVCLGEYYQIFFLENNREIWTSGSSVFEIVSLWSWTVIIFLCMSNILDFYFIYSCSKKVERSDENVKNMISNQAYLRRKRQFSDFIKKNTHGNMVTIRSMNLTKVFY